MGNSRMSIFSFIFILFVPFSEVSGLGMQQAHQQGFGSRAIVQIWNVHVHAFLNQSYPHSGIETAYGNENGDQRGTTRPVFPQLKNRFPGMNSVKFPGIYCNFHETEEGQSALVRWPAQVHNLHNINDFKKINFQGLGVGPSTKWIEIGLCERASEKKMLSQTIKVIFFYMFIYIFHILEFARNFLEFFSFLENYPETIRISRNSGNFLQSGNTEVAPKFNPNQTGGGGWNPPPPRHFAR